MRDDQRDEQSAQAPSRAKAGTGLRARRRAETRVALLRAARDMFEAEGFEATTIRKIASAAGVGTGTVFNYFADKEALLFEALHDDLEAVKDEAIASVDPAAPDADAVAQLTALAMCFYRHYALRPALSRVLLQRSMMASGAWAGRFRAQVEAVAMRAAACVVAAQARGDLSPALDPRVVALAFVSFYYFILLSHLQGPGLDLTGMERQLTALLTQHLHTPTTTTRAQEAAREDQGATS